MCVCVFRPFCIYQTTHYIHIFRHCINIKYKINVFVAVWPHTWLLYVDRRCRWLKQNTFKINQLIIRRFLFVCSKEIYVVCVCVRIFIFFKSIINNNFQSTLPNIMFTNALYIYRENWICEIIFGLCRILIIYFN